MNDVVPVKCAAIAAVALAVLSLAGCGGGDRPDALVSQPSDPKFSASQTPSSSPTDDPAQTTVGSWATAEDGLKFTVSRLTRARVPEVASGGKQGQLAVIVTVKITNGSSERHDLTGSEITVRLGEDGRQAEEVYTNSYGGPPDGTLGPGRTGSHRYMFAAEKASELKQVEVEFSPGSDYGSATFEGKV